MWRVVYSGWMVSRRCTQTAKGAVCKTVIRGFESLHRLRGGIMRKEGFWYEGKGSKYPMPVTRSVQWLGRDRFLGSLSELEAKIKAGKYGRVRRYKGSSRCRICKCINGSIEFEYRNWVWPEGFRHYIRAHNVRPSSAFIGFVTSYKICRGKS